MPVKSNVGVVSDPLEVSAGEFKVTLGGAVPGEGDAETDTDGETDGLGDFDALTETEGDGDLLALTDTLGDNETDTDGVTDGDELGVKSVNISHDIAPSSPFVIPVHVLVAVPAVVLNAVVCL